MITCYDIFITKKEPHHPHFDYFFDELGRLKSIRLNESFKPSSRFESDVPVDKEWSDLVRKIINNELMGIMNKMKVPKDDIEKIPTGNFYLLLKLFCGKHIDRAQLRQSLSNMVNNFCLTPATDVV